MTAPAAARAAHAADQPAAPELGEKLLQIGQRDLLALGDVDVASRGSVPAVWSSTDAATWKLNPPAPRCE